MKRTLLFVLLFCVYINAIYGAERFVSYTNGDLLLNAAGKVGVYVEPDAPRGVRRAAKDLCMDIYKVCGTQSEIIDDASKAGIVIRTKADGCWEKYVLNISDKQVSITGSDRRGTIYGIYELSRQIGVSPWYWWCDVPIEHHDKIYLKQGTYTDGEPKVKYRGIFINDESPSFTGWCGNKFGGVNSKMYAHMFELLLRLKANYLWPAMWGNAFNEDDEQNPVVADEYGIVMGTSHHEPMMRSHQEYLRRKGWVGPWDYTVNKKRLDNFFTEGLERNKRFDQVITISMRGDGDVAMGKGDDDENISTLKDVISNQRRIISQVYGKDASLVPQLWAIFTEVQRYYDRGMTVPDDVIKVFCDNNWGYIRRTGPEKERISDNGSQHDFDRGWKPMGLYYHIDMNGGPWNDRWINTTTIPKLQNQLGLAYRTGLDDLWIVNVGDLKPKEVPIDFIMRYAWNPNSITHEDCHQYMVDFTSSCFGAEHADAIAGIIEEYTNLNLQRKPESQSTGVYSVMNYHEADRMIARWERLVHDADSIKGLIPESQQDAFYHLAYYPAVASAGVALVYLYATKAQTYSAQGRPLANKYIALEKATYAKDKKMEAYYNDSLAGGKWHGMMRDIHFGYKQWFMPNKDSIPECRPVVLADKPALGIAVEGETMPYFDNLDNQTYYIDLFNKGKGFLRYNTQSDKWIKVSDTKGKFNEELRLNVSIDWSLLSEGVHEGSVIITTKDGRFTVPVKAVKRMLPVCSESYYGSMSGKEFSFPANGYAYADNLTFLPGLGRDEGVMTLNTHDASMAYNVYFPEAGSQTILVGVLPTQDVNPERGLDFYIGFDAALTKVDARKGLVDTFGEYNPKALAKSPVLKPVERPNRNIKLISGNGWCRNEVHDNIRWIDVKVNVTKPGVHRLVITRAHPEIMFERFIVNPDNNHYSYLGAPTIIHNKKN